MTVDFTGVADAQIVTVTLANVTDSFSQVLPDVEISVSFVVTPTVTALLTRATPCKPAIVPVRLQRPLTSVPI